MVLLKGPINLLEILMKQLLLFVSIVLATAFSGCSSATEPLPPSSLEFVGEYAIILFEGDGTERERGVLELDYYTQFGYKGKYRRQLADYSFEILPVEGITEGGRLKLQVNPEFADNNMFCIGEAIYREEVWMYGIRGTWEQSGIAGVMATGRFEAYRVYECGLLPR